MTEAQPNAETTTESTTENVDTTTFGGRLELDTDVDGLAVTEAYRRADSSAEAVLGGVYGHEAFFQAIHEYMDREVAEMPVDYFMTTAFYDFEKSVGGDGMSVGAVDKRNCNTLVDGTDRKVAVAKLTLQGETEIGRFMSLVDELDWAIEWGFSKSPRSGFWSVVISPSKKLDY